MSIVGPRPPIPYEVHEYDIWHRKRLDMKPGITGLWQVSGRNRLTFRTDGQTRPFLYRELVDLARCENYAADDSRSLARRGCIVNIAEAIALCNAQLNEHDVPDSGRDASHWSLLRPAATRLFLSLILKPNVRRTKRQCYRISRLAVRHANRFNISSAGKSFTDSILRLRLTYLYRGPRLRSLSNMRSLSFRRSPLRDFARSASAQGVSRSRSCMRCKMHPRSPATSPKCASNGRPQCCKTWRHRPAPT